MRLILSAVLIVFSIEVNVLIINAYQTPVADGYTVGIFPKILKYFLRSIKCLFYICDPFDVIQFIQQIFEIVTVPECFSVTGICKLIVFMQLLELIKIVLFEIK